MEVTVLVERLDEHKYRASTGYPVPMETEEGSREDAVERLREQAVQRLKASELGSSLNPGHPRQQSVDQIRRDMEGSPGV